MAFDPLEEPEQHDALVLAVLRDLGPANQHQIVLELQARQPSWPARKGRPAGSTKDAALLAWLLTAQRRGLVTMTGATIELQPAGLERLSELD